MTTETERYGWTEWGKMLHIMRPGRGIAICGRLAKPMTIPEEELATLAKCKRCFTPKTP